jgi:NADPH2:quinone reductase
MKAMLCKAFGPPDSLAYEDRPTPVVGESQVRVAVRACGVNFPDLLIIAGKYQFQPPFPFAPGSEIAGDVVEVGPKVTRVKLGDRVMGMCGWNGFATEVVLGEAQCLPLPATMDYETGSAISMTYGTSYYALKQRANLRPGETLLVHGATGGVGTSAVDLGRVIGAKIIATGGSDDKLRAIQEAYGVEHVVNYATNPQWKDTVKALTDGKGADVIYDPVGGDVFEQSLRCIAFDGRLLVIGFTSGTIPAAKANLMLLKGCSVVGVFWGMWNGKKPHESRENMDEIFAMHAAGKLKPLISHRFPLERAADALKAIADRKVVGKAVLTVS